MSERVLDLLERYVSPAMARVVFRRSMAEHAAEDDAATIDADALSRRLFENASTFVNPTEHATLARELSLALASRFPVGEHRFRIANEQDVRRARMETREMCVRAETSHLAALKIASALTELSRNIVDHAGSGEVTITFIEGSPRRVRVEARDEGPGIPNVDQYFSIDPLATPERVGGLWGTKQNADRFEIRSSPKGTEVDVELQL